MHANAPALTAIISSRPTRNPPAVAAATNELTPSAAPTCRMNCWLVVALPMRATGTLFCTTTVSAGESSPIPAPAISAAAMTQPSPCSNATMKEESQNVHNNSNHTRKSFADSMDQSSRAEGERAPSNGERANHQAYERAVLMKSGVGCE